MGLPFLFLVMAGALLFAAFVLFVRRLNIEPRERRWPQFTLKGLVGSILLLAIPLGLWHQIGVVGWDVIPILWFLFIATTCTIAAIGVLLGYGCIGALIALALGLCVTTYAYVWFSHLPH